MSTPDPGSFRDRPPASSSTATKSCACSMSEGSKGGALSGTEFFRNAVADGRLIESVEVDPPDGSRRLDSPRLDLITYPYEWTFSMLRDAALLQLDLLEEALSAGLTIKDAALTSSSWMGGRDSSTSARSRPIAKASHGSGIANSPVSSCFDASGLGRRPFQPWLPRGPGRIDPARCRSSSPAGSASTPVPCSMSGLRPAWSPGWPIVQFVRI